MDIVVTLKNIAVAAAKANPQEDGDYFEDGLLHCGKCRTPKQTRLDFSGEIVHCLCSCKAKKQAQEQAEYESRMLRERIARMRREAFRDKAMEDWTFSNDDGSNPALMTAMHRYVDNFKTLSQSGCGLLLYGACGTGKSFAAACVANDLLDRGVNVLMTSFGRILDTVSGLYEGKREYLDSLITPKLLIIDDLGVERDTPYSQETIFNVVDGRIRAGKPMIITTNLSGEQLNGAKDISHQRVFSRLLECCHPIEVKGADRRRLKAKNSYGEMRDLLGL